jgi:hypothetical protein
MENMFDNIWAILGAYTTILGAYTTIVSIIISASFISVQVAINKFSDEIWNIFKSDNYFKTYIYLLPLTFILCEILIMLKDNVPNIGININCITVEYIILNTSKYCLIGFLTILFVFLITFSLSIIPKYLKRVMDILSPEKIVMESMKSISNFKMYSENEKRMLKNITNVFDDLIENKNYETIISCLKIFTGTEFNNILSNKPKNYEEFVKDSKLMLGDIAIRSEHPEISTSTIDFLKQLIILDIENKSFDTINEDVKNICKVLKTRLDGIYKHYGESLTQKYAINTIVDLKESLISFYLKNDSYKEKISKSLSCIIKCLSTICQNDISEYNGMLNFKVYKISMLIQILTDIDENLLKDTQIVTTYSGELKNILNSISKSKYSETFDEKIRVIVESYGILLNKLYKEDLTGTIKKVFEDINELYPNFEEPFMNLLEYKELSNLGGGPFGDLQYLVNENIVESWNEYKNK